MDKESVAIIVSYSVYTAIGLFLHYVIQVYHKNKPLGLQTLLTHVTILSSQTCSCFLIAFWLLEVSSEAIVIMPKWLAILYMLVQMCLWQMFCLAVFLVVTTKYLLIYHGARLALVNDVKLVKRMVIALLTMPLSLVAFELMFITEYQYQTVFQVRFYGSVKSSASVSTISIASLAIVLSSILILLIRTEYDAFMASDVNTGWIARLLAGLKSYKQSDEEQQEHQVETIDNSPYSMNTIRVIELFLIMVVLVMIYQEHGGATSTKWNFLIVSSLIFNAIPMILIVRHDRMRKLAAKIISCN